MFKLPTSKPVNRPLMVALVVAMLFLLLAVNARPAAAQQACQSYHIVQGGENLYRIAQRYNTRWSIVASVNNISNPDRIYAGQRLCIPFTGVGTVVNASVLNVRSGPGVEYGIIDKVSAGAEVQLLGRNSAASWVHVRLSNGKLGWVNASYLRSSTPINSLPVVGTPPPTSSAIGTVTAYHLNARSGPGASYAIVTTFNQGNRLVVTHRNAAGTWVRIVLSGGGTAWVNASYLSLSVPINSLPVA